ncbi:MAG: ubiquinone/menaquinone biosynthesis methyltransferase [Planctomycetota bacterium]
MGVLGPQPSPTPSVLPNAGGKSATEVREMFARVARRYDFLNHFLSLGRDFYWRKVAAREAAGLGPGDVLVDVCTGTGDLAFAFHKAAPEAQIVALDFTQEMIDLALRKAERQKVRAVRFSVGDALALPLPDNSAALAGAAFGLRNVADTERALKELVRVVRPGGKVLVLEFTRPRGRLFGPAYMFYFRRILPLLARVFAAGAGDAYSYLPRSVVAFAGPEELARQLASVGLRDVRAVPLTCGVVHLYVGVK